MFSVTECLYMEPWWSGLTYLFAKEAGLNRPRGFESLRFRYELELLAISRVEEPSDVPAHVT